MSREIGEYMSSNGPQVSKLTCARCMKEFEVIVPPVEVMQTLTVSIIMMQHPNTQDCPHCGMPYAMVISSIANIETTWKPVEKKRESRIIAPPPGLAIPTT